VARKKWRVTRGEINRLRKRGVKKKFASVRDWRALRPNRTASKHWRPKGAPAGRAFVRGRLSPQARGIIR
jgi:hypothetical protein